LSKYGPDTGAGEAGDAFSFTAAPPGDGEVTGVSLAVCFFGVTGTTGSLAALLLSLPSSVIILVCAALLSFSILLPLMFRDGVPELFAVLCARPNQ
jgi:hypothetical protein